MIKNNKAFSTIHSLKQKTCPLITVGIMDRQPEIILDLNGLFKLNDGKKITGIFTAKANKDNIKLYGDNKDIIYSGDEIRFKNNGNSIFTIPEVKIGINFHWENKERQSFRGDLLLKRRSDGTIAIINEIGLEDYLESVISSEMNSAAPMEFLKAHAIISRSWAISVLKKKNIKTEIKEGHKIKHSESLKEKDEFICWYEQESHDLYDVCADDHCQRYQGLTKILTDNPIKAVKETYGTIITYNGDVCDARYSKACGGITEEYRTAWKDVDVLYLKSISDSNISFQPLLTEADVKSWILSKPPAYCHIDDLNILKTILPDFDLKTENFFRWKIKYKREELEEIIERKSGMCLGTLMEIRPLKRGPSGRIYLLEIKGSKRTIRVGKELEIRRLLSNTHLLSSAFIVDTTHDVCGDIDTFTFYGAGWGHGVGLCQIGAGVMALKGYSAEEILKHYFSDIQLTKIY